MRLEDMKKDIPETPDFIHEMIQNEVAKQMQDTKVVDLRRKRWTAPKVAAVAAACALAVSTAAYAGVNLYHWFLEKQGSYGVAVKIDSDGAAKENVLPDEIPEVNLSARYIPEGMSWTDEYHLKYTGQNRAGGFSFVFDLSDNNDLGQVIQDQNVVDSEARTFGEYQGVYLKYNSITKSGTFNQRIYLVCPDLYRVLMIYIGDDVSKEDAIKVAENLVLSESTTMVKTAGLLTWSEDMTVERTEEKNGEMLTSVEEKKLPIYQVGDTFKLDVTGEDINGEYLTGTISVKVDSIQIADDLQLLDPDKIPENWTEAVDSDGRLRTNTLNYVKAGDGIDSLDEIVMSEEVKQKLVYATVTYTNDSDVEIDHMLYLGSLLTMTRENGKAQIYVSTEQAGDDYDRITWDGAAHIGEMFYYSVFENYGNGGNYISSIKPGESVQLNMAWIVNENDLENLYLNVTGDGVTYEFSENILKNGLVEICK